MDSKWISVILLFFGMALFGSATPISKLVGEGFPVFTASTLRVILGSLFLLPFTYKNFYINYKSLNNQAWIEISFIALFGMVGFTVFLIIGMKYITGVAGSIIMSTTPAITALGAFVFLGSPLDWRRILAIIMGVAGIILINIYKNDFVDPSTSHFYLGVLFVLLAISCEALYTLMGKKATEKMDPLFTSFMACVLSIPLFLILSLSVDYQEFYFSKVSAEYWHALLWWGMGTLGAGSALWYSGLKRAEGTTAAGFMSVMPLSALFLSYFLLNESFELIHLPGIFLVLGSIGIMSWVHMTSDQ
ncbi:DMT family transporter [Legionella spiritensis]|uniref:DMT family transporter n=1 Tax=Legionella spiritensis TaxID=452 RepID=UPI000F6CB0C5|nr:DMT family transporter [Legionella spiritensis]VEG92114.1 transmembrane protein [Legionella spiritensis]